MHFLNVITWVKREAEHETDYFFSFQSLSAHTPERIKRKQKDKEKLFSFLMQPVSMQASSEFMLMRSTHFFLGRHKNVTTQGRSAQKCIMIWAPPPPHLSFKEKNEGSHVFWAHIKIKDKRIIICPNYRYSFL